jgi:hypothetical protein
MEIELYQYSGRFHLSRWGEALGFLPDDLSMHLSALPTEILWAVL